jgi:hypothetical protein
MRMERHRFTPTWLSEVAHKPKLMVVEVVLEVGEVDRRLSMLFHLLLRLTPAEEDVVEVEVEVEVTEVVVQQEGEEGERHQVLKLHRPSLNFS